MMREELNLLLKNEINLFNKKSDELLNLINAFEDSRVDSEGRFSILKVLIENQLNDSKIIYEKYYNLQNQVNDLQDLVLTISKSQQG